MMDDLAYFFYMTQELWFFAGILLVYLVIEEFVLKRRG